MIWSRKAICDSGDFGLGSREDQMHRVKLKVPRVYFEHKWQFRMAFGADFDSMVGESAGIDDLRITAYRSTCVSEQKFKRNARSKVRDLKRLALPVVCDEKVAIGEFALVHWKPSLENSLSPKLVGWLF